MLPGKLPGTRFLQFRPGSQEPEPNEDGDGDDAFRGWLPPHPARPSRGVGIGPGIRSQAACPSFQRGLSPIRGALKLRLSRPGGLVA